MVFSASKVISVALNVFLFASLGRTLELVSFDANGSGCPAGTWNATISDDQTAPSLTFDQFTASTGPTTSATDSRVVCQLVLSLNVPEGQQIAFDQITFNNAYNIQSNANVTVRSYYYYQGQTAQSTGVQTTTGPSDSDSDDVTISYGNSIWSPCGGNVIVNLATEVRARHAKSSAEGTWTVLSSPGPNVLTRAC